MASISTSSLAFSPILGPDGRPIARVEEGELFDHRLEAFDGYQANSFLLPQFHPDVFIASKGFDKLDEMLNLAAVRAPLNIIRDAVLYKGWRVEPAVVDKGSADYEQAAFYADALTYCLENMVDEAGNVGDFRQDLFEMLYAIHMGFHVAEIQWRPLTEGPYAGRVGFEGFSHKPCKQIGFDLDRHTLAVRNITSYTPQSGYDFSIPVEKCVRYTFAPKDNLPHGVGVGRMVYKHYWSLDFLYRFWNIALETFGSPFILAKAKANVIALARRIIQQIRQGAPGVLPDGVEAELVETSGTGLAGFKAAAEHHAQQIAFGYLGSTLTTGEGQRSGSLALGKVHQNTQEYGLSGRRVDVENVVNRQVVRRWMRNNWGAESLALAPRLTLGDWDEGDMDRMASAFQRLILSNVLHPAEPQIRERMGLAPIDPELQELMAKVWENPGGVPSTIPGGGGGDNPPGDPTTDPAGTDPATDDNTDNTDDSED